MKQVSFYAPKIRVKRFWSILLLGLPVTSALLLATQSGLHDQVAQWVAQVSSPLEAPYRYPFSDSRLRISSPIAQVEQEIGFYQEHLRQSPGSALDRASLAAAYLRMAKLTGQGNWYLLADEAAQLSLAELPYGNTEAVSVLARVAEARHDFAGALKLAEQLLDDKEAIAIRATSYLALGKINEASQAADALTDLTLSANAFNVQALVRTAQGRDRDALASFQNALAVEEPGDLSNSARTRTLLGRFYYERGQLELANDLYREALRILPTYSMALINLAQLEIRQGRYQAAERHYAKITAITGGAPTVYDPLILRGNARIKALQGDRAGAEADWSRAEALLRQSLVGSSASSFGHRRDLARLLLERGQAQDVAESVSLMEAEVKLRRDAETLDTLAWALSRAGRWQEAQTAIQEAIAQGIRSPGIFYRAGTIEKALGNPSQAQLYFQNAQDVDPQFGDRAQHALGLSAGLGS